MTTNVPTNRPLRRPTRMLTVLVALVALLLPLGGGMAAADRGHGHGPRPTIVLVHGDWADASSWSAVISKLHDRGYDVVAPPNPLRGPSSDAAYLASFLQTIPGPIVLVAHSYGGFVITNAATGNANVTALVYIDAFIPDVGEALVDLTAGSCLDPASAFNAVPSAGGVVDLYLRTAANPPYQGFATCFANGVDRRQAATLAAVQRPAALSQLGEPSGSAAWATIPSWSLIGTADRVITPAQQRAMSTRAGAHVSTVNAGHLSLISKPEAVVKIVLDAVDATT